MKTRVGKIMGVFVVFIVVIAITTVSLGKLDDTKEHSKPSKEEQKDREHATKEEQKDREHATKEEQKDREHANKEEKKDREHANKEEKKENERGIKNIGTGIGGNTGEGTKTGTVIGGNTGEGTKTGNIVTGETGGNIVTGETGGNIRTGETGGNIRTGETGGSTCLIPEGCASTPILKNFIGRGSYKGFDNSKIIGEPDIFEELEFDLKFGVPTNYSFSVYDFAVYEMVAIDKENENKVGIRVTNIKNMSIFSNVEIPEIIFKNESVVTESQRLNNLLIKFKVNNSWIESNKISRENIHLYKLANDSSQLLETILINKDDKYTYFESNESVEQMDRLQLFAISGKV